MFNSKPDSTVNDFESHLESIFKQSASQIHKLKEKDGDADTEELADKLRADDQFWSGVKDGGYFFPARGGKLGPRFTRALARDEDLKQKYAAASAEGRDSAAKFRAKWAEEAHHKFINHKDCYCYHCFVFPRAVVDADVLAVGEDTESSPSLLLLIMAATSLLLFPCNICTRLILPPPLLALGLPDRLPPPPLPPL